MRKGHAIRRTMVKEAGKPNHVLLKKVDNLRKGSRACDLQKHLHQLFHHYHEEGEETDEGEQADGEDEA